MSRHWNGQKLRGLRGTKPQADLAKELNVSRTRVVAWEAGEDPRFSNAIAIADHFGISLDSLVTSVIEEERATPTDRRGKPTRDDDPTAKPSVVPTHGGV